MKLLRSGRSQRADPPWLGVWRCRSCGAVVELEQSDASVLHPVLLDMDGREAARVYCPTCERSALFDRPAAYVAWWAR